MGVPMKSRFWLFISVLFFLLIFYSTFTFAGDYSFLIKNGYIEAVDSQNGQVKNDQDNKITSKEENNYRSGKLSIGMTAGFSHLFLVPDNDVVSASPLIGINAGYWINNRIYAGVGSLYHIYYRSTDSDGGPDISLVSILPQIKFCIFDKPLTPTLGLGIGSVTRFFDNKILESTTYYLNINGGYDYYFGDFNKGFSAGINFAYNIVPVWKAKTGDYLRNETSSYMTILLEINYLFII